MQRVDAVGDVEGRAFVALRQEIAHRPVERPRQPHGHAFGGHERERAVDAANAVRLTREDAAARLVERHVAEAVQGGIEEIHDPADGLKHGRNCCPADRRTQGAVSDDFDLRTGGLSN